MSNIISLPVARRKTPQERAARLIEGFAGQRRSGDDVFWLKENAELLGILECSGMRLSESALVPFEGFYATIEKRLRFFPQYYRFLLSLCLDLEDLGMPGNKGEALCNWAMRSGLAQAELSDLQRAEARRLFERRGVGFEDAALTERLHGFIGRSTTFAMPNKKAAYELTHIVFYLSDYGRHDPGLSEAAITSLEFAGLLAYLDQNFDLLAEICVALRFAGHVPSDIWEGVIAQALSQARIEEASDLKWAQDSYHEYLVAAWSVRAAGGVGFGTELPDGPMQFVFPTAAGSALRPMSACMYELDDARDGDWSRMRRHVSECLGPDGQDILNGAEQSTDKFDAFFEGFARIGSLT